MDLLVLVILVDLLVRIVLLVLVVLVVLVVLEVRVVLLVLSLERAHYRSSQRIKKGGISSLLWSPLRFWENTCVPFGIY